MSDRKGQKHNGNNSGWHWWKYEQIWIINCISSNKITFSLLSYCKNGPTFMFFSLPENFKLYSVEDIKKAIDH